jgi:hypothetical protein
MTDAVTTSYENHIKALATATELNKAAVFEILAGTAITGIEVEFDGEGDSGGITAVQAYTDDMPVALPALTVRIRPAGWDANAPVETEETLAAVIETLCYDYLQQAHGGWENDDGGYGVFRFDVAARAIELEFNARFTDVHVSTHAF